MRKVVFAVAVVLAVVLPGAAAAVPARFAHRARTTTPVASSTGGLTAAEQVLASSINAARAANGLPALAIDSSLESAARDHTQELLANGAFTHDFVKYGLSYPFATWISWYFHGACAGENIAEGQPTLGTDQAVQLWLNSPPHRENLLSTRYTRMGVAVETSNGTAIATNDFGC